MTKTKSKVQLIILGLVIIILGLVAVLGPDANPIEFGDYDYRGFMHTIKLGLDLKGGVYAVYRIDESEEKASDAAVNGTIDNLQRMLFSKGFTEAVVVSQGTAGNRQIRVEVPDVEDPQAIFDLIGEPAYLEFKIPEDEDPNAEPYLTGKNVDDAYVNFNENGEPVVVLKFDDEGKVKFQTATTERQGKKIGIYINGTLRSSPTVNDIISTGEATITGIGSYEDCNALALQIQSGSFSVSLELMENRVISPTLGLNALKMSIIAGVIGLALIIIFMIVIYRMLGAAASMSLMLYVVLILIVLAIVPWVQLTLAGIGGIVLGIGMAVDANIIIFERIKDEYRKGKPIPAAVSMGFKRAGRAVLDSNLTTIIGAIVLLVFGPASLQSFAITLIISIVLSFFTAIVITRRIVKLFLVLNNKKAKLYNLRNDNDGLEKIHKLTEKVKNSKFTEKYKKWFAAPIVIVAVALIMFTIFAFVNQSFGGGMNLGIDFTGGTIMSVDLGAVDGKLNLDDEAVYSDEVAAISNIIESKGYKIGLVQRVEGNIIQIRYNAKSNNNEAEQDNEDIAAEVQGMYAERYGTDAKGVPYIQTTDVTNYFISATSSSQLLLKALLAVAVALVATLLYIALRFKLRYGLAAVLTLITDVVLLVAVTIILRVPVNASFIAALVTIIGYAINDVIVIFDRIRENISLLENKTKYNTFEVTSVSISETLTRSIYTTITTLITIIMLALLGESTMREFALPIIIGLVIGLFTSLFIAPSIWALLVKDEMRRLALKKRTVASEPIAPAVLKPALADGAPAQEKEAAYGSKPAAKNVYVKSFKKKK